MNDNEHLALIETHLLKLLAIAEKRTQGKWREMPAETTPATSYIQSKDGCVAHHAWKRDAIFIAACAGNAEAGWKSTLAAIHTFAAIAETDRLRGFTESAAMDAINEILASWPIELLQ